MWRDAALSGNSHFSVFSSPGQNARVKPGQKDLFRLMGLQISTVIGLCGCEPQSIMAEESYSHHDI